MATCLVGLLSALNRPARLSHALDRPQFDRTQLCFVTSLLTYLLVIEGEAIFRFFLTPYKLLAINVIFGCRFSRAPALTI